VQGGEDGAAPFGRRAHGHMLGAYHLERQGDAGEQRQDGVNRGGVRESCGAEKPGRDYVVDEICDPDQSRPRQQREAAADELRFQGSGRQRGWRRSRSSRQTTHIAFFRVDHRLNSGGRKNQILKTG